MLDILEAYIDLNELDNKQELMNAGEALEYHDDKEIVNLARSGYVLTGWMNHVSGAWTLEQFMQVGDAGLGLLDASEEHMEMFDHAHTGTQILGNTLRRHAPTYIATHLGLDDMRGANTTYIVEQQIREEYSQHALLQASLEERGSGVVLL